MTSELVRQYKSPAAVLEVGGGTGSITKVIAQALQPGDLLDVYEIDAVFSDIIVRRLQTDPSFSLVRESICVHNSPIEKIERRKRYDFIISCLPFTCFDPGTVRDIFEIYRDVLKQDGVCSFFEYVFVRKAARLVCGSAAERHRLSEVAKVVADYAVRYCYKRTFVLRNIPPAIVHYISFNSATTS
jgi:phospholipid N-methyltransferase